MKKFLSMVLTVAMLLSCMTLLAVPASATGNTYSESDYDNTTNFTITTAEDLRAFLGSTKNFLGKTVKVADGVTELVLNDTTGDWVSGATAVAIGARYFEGVFDGNGVTIKGLYINSLGDTSANWWKSAGMFAAARCAVIKNFTLDGFCVDVDSSMSGNEYDGHGIAAIMGKSERGNTVENCTLKNGVITCSDNTTVPKMGTIYGFGQFNNASAADGSTTGVIGNELKIINTTVEETVKIVYNGTTNGVLRNFGFGAVGGYSNSFSAGMTIDFTGSSFKTVDKDGNLITKVSGNVFGKNTGVVTLKSGSWSYVIEARGDSGEGHFDEQFNYYAGSADCGILPVLPSMPTDNTFSTLNYTTDTEFVISTAEDYLAFDAAVHGGDKDFAGKTVKLANDIVLNDTTVTNWTATATNKLRTNNPASASYFRGTFDGCDHTIYGLYIGGHAGWWRGTGMFAGTGYDASKQTGSATIRNLTLDGFYMSSGAWDNKENIYEAYSVGAFIGRSQGGDAIINCKLKNGVLTTDNSVGDPKMGALIGINKGGSLGTLTISDVIVEDSVKVAYTGTLFGADVLIDPRMTGVGGAWVYPNIVFTSEVGNYYCRSFTNKKLKQILVENDMPSLSVHGLRHSNASLLINNGYDVKAISEHLGHCNTEITSNIYVHIFKEYKAKMAESIEHDLL